MKGLSSLAKWSLGSSAICLALLSGCSQLPQNSEAEQEASPSFFVAREKTLPLPTFVCEKSASEKVPFFLSSTKKKATA